MGDAVYFLSKKLNPEVIHMESVENIHRMIEMSDIEIFALDTALENAGIKRDELINFENVKIANIEEISDFIIQADTIFRY